MAGAAPVEFGVLGALEARYEAAALPLGRTKQRALLALLLAEANRSVSVDRMVDELWGDEPPAKAMASLQAYVSNLRRLLEPHRSPGTPRLIVTEPPGYRIVVSREQLDSLRFEDLAARTRALLGEGRPGEALDTATQALALWRGPAFAEFRDEGFGRVAAAHLDQVHQACEEDCSEALVLLGRYTDAAVELERAVRRAPLRERRWALLMVALYRAGRSADALARYQEVRRLLADELGIDPGPLLAGLELGILNHDDDVLAAALTVEELRPVVPQAATRPVPAPSTLLERSSELVAAEEVVQRVLGGQPGFIVVEGEAGLGKTTLVEEIAAGAERSGLYVAWGACHEDGDSPPLWPWVQILRSLDVEVPRLEPGAEEFAVLDAVTGALARRARHGPVACVVEDIHWADGGTRRLLSYLAVEFRGVPVLVVTTARSDERRDLVGPVVATLLRRRESLHLALRPLSAAATATLAARIGGDRVADSAHELHARTGGNPLFVTELARLFAAEGPRSAVPFSVHEVIARRLRRLPAEVNALLEVAAVAGIDVDLELLAEASGLSLERVAELCDAPLAMNLLQPGTAMGGVMFPHALVRETILTSVSDLQRRRLHAQVAIALSDHAEGRGPAGYEHAHHAVRAVPFVPADQARRAATWAAGRAERELAFEVAAGWWREALSVHETTGVDAADPTRIRLLLSLAGSLRRSGAEQPAQDSIAEALELATGLGDVPLVVQAVEALGDTGGAWLWVGPVGNTLLLERVRRVLDLLDPGDHAARASVLGTLATGSHMGADPTLSDELSAEAVELARRVGDPTLVGRALSVRWRAIWQPGRAGEQLVVGQELEALSSEVTAGDLDLSASVCLHVAHLTLGHVPAAVAALDRALALTRDRRLPSFEAQLLPNAATLDLLKGDVAGAEERIAEIIHRWERLRHPLAGALRATLLSLLRRQQGRLSEVAPDIAQFLAGPPLFERRWEAIALASEDRFDAARAAVAEVELGSVAARFDGTASAVLDAELAADLGLAAVASRAADALAPHVDEIAALGTAGVLGPVAVALGRAAAAAGRPSEAERYLRRAIEVSRRNALTTSRIWAEVRLAEVLLAGGESREALSLAWNGSQGAREHGLVAAAASAAAITARLTTGPNRPGSPRRRPASPT